MMPRTAPKDARGFSLIELLAALSIFSFGVVGAMQLFTINLRAANTSLNYTQAVYLAQEVMEETIAEGFFIEGADSGAFGDNYPNHSWESEIEETEQYDLYKIAVVVTWIERGQDRTYTLTTLAAERL